MLGPASAAGQCARLGSLNGRPNTRVIVPGFLPELFVVRCALRHIAMEKGNQLSTVDTFFGKSSEVIAPTGDAADEFNVDDRQTASGAAEAVTNDNLVVVQIDI